MGFFKQIGSNKALEHPVRIKALSFVSWLVRLKRKSILKKQMVTPILNVLFPIMCEPLEEEDNEEEFEEAEASTASSFAAQVLSHLYWFNVVLSK